MGIIASTGPNTIGGIEMKRAITAVLVLLTTVGAVAHGVEDSAAVAEVTRSLEQIASEVQALITQEKINSLFDQYRKLVDFGVTYQPRLVAPNDLAAKLDEKHLKLYAGLKLFDAIYAATFMKRQEVADSVKAIEDVQTALDLRSYADLSGRFLETLKKAAAEPESIDVQKLIEQLSADFVSEVPALMANEKSADYLIDGLYAFLIQMSYVTGSLMAGDTSLQIEKGFDQLTVPANRQMVLDVFKAFDRMDEQIRVSGETVDKLAVVQQACYLVEAERSGKLTDEDAEKDWTAMAATVNAIRDSIISPDAE